MHAGLSVALHLRWTARIDDLFGIARRAGCLCVTPRRAVVAYRAA